MSKAIRESELEAYLDEGLPAPEMARIEQALRSDAGLCRQLAAVVGRRDAGVHTLGEIWRRHRLTCLGRDALGTYLLGAMPREQADYLDFHLRVVGCRVCLASLEDLRRQQAESQREAQIRRRRYFRSSVGRLRRD